MEGPVVVQDTLATKRAAEPTHGGDDRLLSWLTNMTDSPSVFGIDVDPTCPGRCSAASAPRAALPQRATCYASRDLGTEWFGSVKFYL
jgi:hypothetical protein